MKYIKSFNDVLFENLNIDEKIQYYEDFNSEIEDINYILENSEYIKTNYELYNYIMESLEDDLFEGKTKDRLIAVFNTNDPDSTDEFNLKSTAHAQYYNSKSGKDYAAFRKNKSEKAAKDKNLEDMKEAARKMKETAEKKQKLDKELLDNLAAKRKAINMKNRDDNFRKTKKEQDEKAETNRKAETNKSSNSSSSNGSSPRRGDFGKKLALGGVGVAAAAGMVYGIHKIVNGRRKKRLEKYQQQYRKEKNPRIKDELKVKIEKLKDKIK